MYHPKCHRNALNASLAQCVLGINMQVALWIEHIKDVGISRLPNEMQQWNGPYTIKMCGRGNYIRRHFTLPSKSIKILCLEEYLE